MLKKLFLTKQWRRCTTKCKLHSNTASCSLHPIPRRWLIVQQYSTFIWMSYLGGADAGYEAGRSGVGMSNANDLTKPTEVQRLTRPVLSATDTSAKWYDNKTIFKSTGRFACSYDLINWTDWNGANLVEPSEPYDQQYAHKPWMIKWNGVVYHFYNAVGTKGRVIALATSKDLKH